MKTIYKYYIPVGDQFTVPLPKGAEILSFQVDNKDNRLYIWAKVDTKTEDMNHRNFTVVGTGNPIFNDRSQYIGTAQQGSFVWHLFENI